jgi:phosphoribosylformylglycinamidine synthase PurS subunit
MALTLSFFPRKLFMPQNNGANTMISATVRAMFCRIILRSPAGGFEFRVSSFELDRSFEKHTCTAELNSKPETLNSKPKLMKAKVYVTLKPSVLDPQGKAIKHSVELLGYRGVSDIRQGKYFEIALNGGLSDDDARSEAERMAREVLSNPIIEDFRVEIEE